MRCGIEFEYLIVDLDGPEPGRVRDFGNLTFEEIRPLLEDKPGRDDTTLATGDLGIRSGYWYLEGDERFHEDGSFRTLMVKGVEIRTPPAPDVDQAIRSLVEIEAKLAAVLARHGLGLAIASFNPVRARYDFDPPLNAWEQALRHADRGYDGSHVSTLSYGPDINLSMPGWSAEQNLDAARKLNFYSPFIVPFSFGRQYYAGALWHGQSKRTFERTAHRPAVRLYVAPETAQAFAPESRLIHPSRIAHEAGRIEFKAFDAMPSLERLTACCHLLEGICLATDLPGRSEEADLALYQQAALTGFNDAILRDGATQVLRKAGNALRQAGRVQAAKALASLESHLSRCLEARDLCQSVDDALDHRQINPGFAAIHPPIVVLTETA